MPAGAPRPPSALFVADGDFVGIFSSQIPNRYRKDILSQDTRLWAHTYHRIGSALLVRDFVKNRKGTCHDNI